MLPSRRDLLCHVIAFLPIRDHARFSECYAALDKQFKEERSPWCVLCGDLLRFPHVLRDCGHVACGMCIWKQTYPEHFSNFREWPCPVCNAPMRSRPAKVTDYIAPGKYEAALATMPAEQRAQWVDWHGARVHNGPRGHFGGTWNLFDDAVLPGAPTPGVAKLRSFRDGVLMDFTRSPPVVDWSDDKSLQEALEVPFRLAAPGEATKWIPTQFQEYDNPHRFDLARVIYSTCTRLAVEDLIPEELKREWDVVLQHHEATRRILFDPCAGDHDSFVMLLRVIFENACGKATDRLELSTWMGNRSGRSTTWAWIQASCGGYAVEVSSNSFRRASHFGAPSELPHIEGCCFAACELPARERLDLQLLREVAHRSLVSVRRLYEQPRQFVFHGHLILMCEEPWLPDEPLNQQVIRLCARMPFRAATNHDHALRSRVHQMVPEFWFLARVFWLCGTPRQEEPATQPQHRETKDLSRRWGRKAEGETPATSHQLCGKNGLTFPNKTPKP